MYTPLLCLLGFVLWTLLITVLAKRPKHRRHARGGLRRLTPARVHKYTAHGMSGASGGAIDAPWTFTMPVTKAP